MRGRVGGVIFILVGLVVGGLGYGLGHYIGLPTLQLAKASVNWPSVPGKVTSSSIKRETKPRRDSRKRRDTTMYRHHVEYTYEIDGHSRTGNVVWFGDGYSSSSVSSHQAVVDRYPAGKEVVVYYDPEHRELCVLEPGAKFSSYVFYGVGWLLLGIASILVFCGLKSLVFPK